MCCQASATTALCAGYTPPPALSPSTPPPAMWTVLSGSNFCELTDGGACVSDGSGNYGNNENCVVQANADFVVSARAFAVEYYYDHITIHGSQYSGDLANAPTGVTMSSGDKLYWSSDGSVVASGFEICATIPVPMPMAPPNPPSTPFGAIFYSFDTDNGLSSGWSTGPTLGNGAALSQPYGWARRSGGTAGRPRRSVSSG